MSLTRAADLYYTYRFIKTLVTPWTEMDAFKYGIIDDKGKNLRRARELLHAKEKDSYTTFHRLVFNIKRILEKVPFGKSKLASYAAALFLLREETGMSEESIIKALNELGHDTSNYLSEDIALKPYILTTDINENAKKGKVLTLDTLIGTFNNIPIYKATTGEYVTAQNIT
jgi:hypothetical protein